MARYLPSSREERAKRRATMLADGRVIDPAMLRVALAEAEKLPSLGKKSARRVGRRGVIYAYRGTVG